MIGLDPAWQAMIDSARRCQRERLANALFVCASAEDPPEELHGVADEITVLMPWGRLLSGVVLGESGVCRGLRFMAQPRAALRVVVGTDIWNPPVPKEIAGLPRLTLEYVDTTLTPRLAEHGWKITAVSETSTVDIATSWAKRLATGRSYVDIRAEAG